MKKTLSIAIASFALSGLAVAGDWGKAPVEAKMPIIDPGCACYDAGFEISGFGAGLVPDSGDDEFSGGASLGYFFSDSVGLELSYSVFDTEPSEEHVATANLVYRFVNKDACVAPYIMAGGGVITNGSTHGIVDAGAGIDLRFDSLGCVGIFADATYNWVTDGDSEDFTLIRAGFRIPF